MSEHTSYGHPKVQHETKASAYQHLREQQVNQLHQMQVYRCSRCRYWHIGRRPQTRQLKNEKYKATRIEEILIGKLIGVLRGTYKGNEE